MNITKAYLIGFVVYFLVSYIGLPLQKDDDIRIPCKIEWVRVTVSVILGMIWPLVVVDLIHSYIVSLLNWLFPPKD